MKKYLVIDDDPLICDLICHFCSKLSAKTACVSVVDGQQGLSKAAEQQFDALFLDFNLPDLNGKQLLDLLPADVPVVMVTSETDFGATSYEYGQVVDFLVKPLSYDRFLKAVLRLDKYNERLSRVNGLVASKKERLLVKDGNTSVVLVLDEVRYIESASNYVFFHKGDKKVMSLMSLKSLESKLPTNFVRVHKSYIVNLSHLESITTEEIMIEGVEVPVGPKYKEILASKVSAWDLN